MDLENKKKPLIFGKINKVHTISLPKFDLSNPASFVAFADNTNLDTESGDKTPYVVSTKW